MSVLTNQLRLHAQFEETTTANLMLAAADTIDKLQETVDELRSGRATWGRS